MSKEAQQAAAAEDAPLLDASPSWPRPSTLKRERGAAAATMVRSPSAKRAAAAPGAGQPRPARPPAAAADDPCLQYHLRVMSIPSRILE
eukprot:COSAG01_NODE_1199_length_11292_cov_69.798267_2_plen_89_part_00